MIHYWLLLCIILLEGFVTISVEILTIRQLIPAVGSNVIVTSLIIGVFLLFLAYGYRKGGECRENFAAVLKRNFMAALAMIGIGLSNTFIEALFNFLQRQLALPSLLILMFYLLIIIAPIVYLLGQTVPITMNLFKRDISIGAISGKVLHVSTIGSFLGSVLTTLVLMNFLGVAWTVVINVVILGLLTLLLNREQHVILYVVCASLIAGWVNVVAERAAYVTTTPYADYSIVNNVQLADGRQGKLLMVNHTYSSFLDHEHKGFNYIEQIKKILFEQLHLKHKNILVIGAGGFTLSEGNSDNKFTYVDVDKALYQQVSKKFLGPINGEFINADGRRFLKETQHQYDVIVSDVFSNRYSIPAHLLTREHIANIWRALRADGLAVFNIIAMPTLEDAYSKRVDNTLRSVFTSCMAMPLEYHQAMTNILYICKKSPREADKTIYRDDKNTSMLDLSL